ncbi:MAG: putative ABC transporter permease [Oscillospiraceae bacterium]|nr:putative ABC transporter permease [Oscillospiraceae bacterium]
MDRNPLIKIFWLFIIGSLLGCVYETILTLVRTGQFQRRVSLLYGPFSTIYGFGAVTLFIVFALFKNRPNVFAVFAYGAVVCTIVEFFFAWVQQKAFGTHSWDYSNQPLNIQGRVCLYSFLAWGGLAIIWVWLVEPLFEKLLHLIPNGAAVPLTAALFTLLMLDAGITLAAMLRWADRLKGLPAGNAFAAWLDKAYPNGYMELIFPSLKFVN